MAPVNHPLLKTSEWVEKRLQSTHRRMLGGRGSQSLVGTLFSVIYGHMMNDAPAVIVQSWDAVTPTGASCSDLGGRQATRCDACF